MESEKNIDYLFKGCLAIQYLDSKFVYTSYSNDKNVCEGYISAQKGLIPVIEQSANTKVLVLYAYIQDMSTSYKKYINF